MDVIKELMATTQRYVKDNRLAIRTVAQALKAAGSLTGDQVDALLGVSR
jgi:ATP-dependent Zn protease